MACSWYKFFFFGFIVANIAFYVLIGYYTNKVNRDNVKRIVNKYQQYACDCYFVSKHPASYTIHGADDTVETNRRFDFSHIIPKCTDCNYCNRAFNESGICLQKKCNLQFPYFCCKIQHRSHSIMTKTVNVE